MTSADASAAAYPTGAALRGMLERNLARPDRVTFDLDGRRHAAVAVVVLDALPPGARPPAGGGADEPALADAPDGGGEPGGDPMAASEGPPGVRIPHVPGEPSVVLTRRQARLRAHAGQWALPGGRLDQDEDAVEAALRELREEIALDLDRSSVLGLLDDYPTRSGYVITPVVLWGGQDPAMHPQEDEVGSIHRLPFRELCRSDSPVFVSIPESDRPVLRLPIGDNFLHAPTGAVLLQLRRLGIEGTYERVADYEQPVFAWR